MTEIVIELVTIVNPIPTLTIEENVKYAKEKGTDQVTKNTNEVIAVIGTTKAERNIITVISVIEFYSKIEFVDICITYL